MCFFRSLGISSLLATGRFSCSRLRCTRGARPDPARKCEPWQWSVARALGVQSGKSALREILDP